MKIDVTVTSAASKMVTAEIDKSCNMPVRTVEISNGCIVDAPVEMDCPVSSVSVVTTYDPLRKIDNKRYEALAMQRELEDHIRRDTVHGTESPVVGRTDEEELENKTLDGGFF